MKQISYQMIIINFYKYIYIYIYLVLAKKKKKRNMNSISSLVNPICKNYFPTCSFGKNQS